MIYLIFFKLRRNFFFRSFREVSEFRGGTPTSLGEVSEFRPGCQEVPPSFAAHRNVSVCVSPSFAKRGTSRNVSDGVPESSGREKRRNASPTLGTHPRVTLPCGP